MRRSKSPNPISDEPREIGEERGTARAKITEH
jgi:hypothetical protein